MENREKQAGHAQNDSRFSLHQPSRNERSLLDRRRTSNGERMIQTGWIPSMI